MWCPLVRPVLFMGTELDLDPQRNQTEQTGNSGSDLWAMLPFLMSEMMRGSPDFLLAAQTRTADRKCIKQVRKSSSVRFISFEVMEGIRWTNLALLKDSCGQAGELHHVFHTVFHLVGLDAHQTIIKPERVFKRRRPTDTRTISAGF